MSSLKGHCEQWMSKCSSRKSKTQFKDLAESLPWAANYNMMDERAKWKQQAYYFSIAQIGMSVVLKALIGTSV